MWIQYLIYLQYKHFQTEILPKLLSKCKKVKLLIIHNHSLSESTFRPLTQLNLIHELVLANTFFALDFRNRRPSFLTLLLNKSHLRKLMVFVDNTSMPSKANVFTVKTVKTMSTAKLKTLMLQGILLGPKAFEEITNRYYNTLTECMIGGALCDSRAGAQYFGHLGKKRLKLVCTVTTFFYYHKKG